MYYLKDLRNKITHHEQIYQFKFDLHKLTYKIWLVDPSMSQEQIKKIILNDIVQFISDGNSLENDFKLF